MRASDEDRERVAQEIREHFAAGRLSEEELDERVQGAYSARTDEDLRAVRADLPQLPASTAQLKAELSERRAELRRRLLQESGGGFGAFLLCVGIWAASGAHGSFWPIWVLLVTAVALARGAWRLYGPAPELDKLEEELDRRRHHGGRRRELRRGR
jgi:Domain of unknown function (DUF1707)